MTADVLDEIYSILAEEAPWPLGKPKTVPWGEWLSLPFMSKPAAEQVRRGRRHLGSGAFGSVFDNNDGTVTKVVTSSDRCYVEFAKAALADGGKNPFFPRVYAVSDLGNGRHEVKIEKLFPLRREDWKQHRLLMILCAVATWYDFDKEEWREDPRHGTMFDSGYTDLDAAIKAIGGRGVPDAMKKVARQMTEVMEANKCLSDIMLYDTRNAMKRADGHLVVTDPFWTPDGDGA